MKKFLKYFFIVLIILVVVFFLLGVFKPEQEYTFSINVNSPVDKTFAVFNDTTRMREWMPNFQKIENISGSANQTGSKWRIVFHDHGKEIEMTETVTAFENNKLFAFDIENDFIVSHNDIHFDESANQTQITVHAKYKGGNMFSRSLFVLMNSSVKKMQAENFLMLKKIVENG